jgi:hypothetical protein
MEEHHLAENRGCSIDSILESIREKMMPLPVFEDRRTSPKSHSTRLNSILALIRN